jgi:hypothetical protein
MICARALTAGAAADVNYRNPIRAHLDYVPNERARPTLEVTRSLNTMGLGGTTAAFFSVASTVQAIG